MTTRRGPAPTKHLDILWAAARLFGSKGVASTTTREIAAEAQTTERTLFKHFGNKEALVHAVVSEAVLAHLTPTSMEALKTAIEANDGDLERWHNAFLRSRMVATAESPELTRLLLVELLRDEELRRVFAQQWSEGVWQPLLALFGRLQNEGKLRRDIGAEALARMFLSVNIGHLVARHVLAPDAKWDDLQDVASIAAFFARGGAAAKA